MVIAVIAMHVVQTSADQIIGVSAMGDLRMSAAGPMRMAATCLIRFAAIRRIRTDLDHMFVDVVTMHVMQVTVMQIVDVALVTDRHVAAIFTVLMNMLRMMAPCARHRSLH